MHIFEALMKDHRKIKDLVQELLSIEDDDLEARSGLIEDIRDELVPHSRAEESIFYNSLRALEAGKDQVMHAYKEHLEAESLLRALQVEDKMNIQWRATAIKLKDALEHHIHEEETEVFAAARNAISNEEAQTLGDLFVKFKPKYQEEGFMKNTMDMMINLLPPKFTQAVRNLKPN